MRSFAPKEAPRLRASPAPAAPKKTRAQPPQAQGAHARAFALAGLSTPARAAPSALQADVEARTGVALGDVRVHEGPEASVAASSIGASAFTAGNDVVLGDAGPPGSPAHRRVLSHELAHVAQQTGTSARASADLPLGQAGDVFERHASAVSDAVMGGGGAVPPPPRESRATVRRAPAPPNPNPPQQAPVIPPFGPTFEEEWKTFEATRAAGNDAEAVKLMRGLAHRIPYDLGVSTGRDVGFWLLDQKEPELAQQVLHKFHWGIPSVRSVGKMPTWTVSDDPAEMLERGKKEAAAGKHEIAFQLLGIAAYCAQFALIDISNAEKKSIEKAESGVSGTGDRRIAMAQASRFGLIGATGYHASTEHWFTMIRSVFQVYPALQRAAISKKDDKAATEYARLAAGLEKEILDNYSTDTQVITMETQIAKNERGETGYELQGTKTLPNTEVVTPLPGTKTVDELGAYPTFDSSTNEILKVVSQQEQFLASVTQLSGVQKAFGGKRIDMNDRAQRIKLWSAIYASYVKDNPYKLGAVLAYMQTYLTNFTRHTEYNVRDFGQSYLTTEMPTDVVGRAARDCGVYALTTAYEVYRTAHDASPRLPVQFRLYVFPEHVALGIFDNSDGNYYLVNNDKISFHNKGKPDDPQVIAEIAKVFGETMQRKFVVAPFLQLGLGTSDVSDAGFKDNAWKTYQGGTAWGLRPTPKPGDTRTDEELKHDTYKDYYRDLAKFDADAAALQKGLDVLGGQTEKLPAKERAAFLGGKLPTVLKDVGFPLGRTFEMHGPKQPTAVDPRSPHKGVLLGQKASYLFYSSPRAPGEPHPLARLGNALLLWKSLGGGNTDADGFIAWLGGIPQFAEALKAYQDQGLPVRF